MSDSKEECFHYRVLLMMYERLVAGESVESVAWDYGAPMYVVEAIADYADAHAKLLGPGK